MGTEQESSYSRMNGPVKIFASLQTDLGPVLTAAVISAVCAVLYRILTGEAVDPLAGTVFLCSIGFALCYTLLKHAFGLFADRRISAPAVSVPAILLAVMLRSREVDGIMLGMLALFVYILWLFLVILPFRVQLSALLCLLADGVMAVGFFNGHSVSNLTGRLLFASLFVLSAYYLRVIIGRRDGSTYPFAGFLMLLVFLMFIPSREDPINWDPVIDAGRRIADNTREMIWSLSYYIEDLRFSSKNYTGYGSLSQSGGFIKPSEKTEIELKTRDNTTFNYTDEKSGKKLKRRRVVYLTGGKAVDHEQLLDMLFSLYAHGIGWEEASLYARSSMLDIDYVYLKTGDEIMPVGTVKLTDNKGENVSEGVGRKHKKGYGLHAKYLDLDYGSPYLIRVIASPVHAVKKTSVDYKKMYLYAYNNFGLRLDELVSEESYVKWQNESADKAEYLDVSGSTQRMLELAKELTADCGNDHEKCVILEDYLRQYKYTMDTGASKGMDIGSTVGMSGIADGFLFETGKGYCVHFASSMVMLLRLNGIPARLCSGYRYVFPFERKDVYEVRAESAHVWPEAYIEGFGWVPFEPTATLTTATERTWHRHPEARLAGTSAAYYTQNHGIPVPEPVTAADDMIKSGMEERNDGISEAVRIILMIILSVLAVGILLMLLSAGFKALRYRMADNGRRLELDVADITGIIRSYSGLSFEDRGVMSDYEPYIPGDYIDETKHAFDILNRLRYGHFKDDEERVSAKEQTSVRDLRNRMHKEYKRRRFI